MKKKVYRERYSDVNEMLQIVEEIKEKEVKEEKTKKKTTKKTTKKEDK